MPTASGLPSRDPRPLERDIQRDVLAWLRAVGVVVIRVNSGAAPGQGGRRYVRFTDTPGVSDLIGLLPDGLFLAIELKRPGERPTEHQRKFLDAVSGSGGLAFVAHSVADVEAALRAEGWRVVLGRLMKVEG